MLSRQLSNCKAPHPEIKLPEKSVLETRKSQPIPTSPTNKLSAMCNFDPIQIACSPPDGMFIHNLRIRIENV